MTQQLSDNRNETLLENAELFHLIAENIQDYAILMTDLEGRISRWNEGVERLVGYSASEIVGQSIDVIFTAEDVAAGAPGEERERAANTGRSEDRRWHQHKNGRRFWASGIVVPLKNNDGAVRGYAKIVRDDSAHKLAEEKLEQTNRRVENILSSISDSFYIFDSELRYLYVNEATTKMFGFTETEFLGKTLWELFPDVAGNKFHQEILRAFKEQTTIVFENYYSPLDRWFENRVYPSKESLSIFTAEITERKRAEHALRESEERYRTLFDSIDEGFCVIEMIFDEHEKAVDYLFLEINPAFEKQTGLKDAINKRIREFSPHHEEFWFEIYGKVALTGESIRFENRSAALNRWYDVYAFRVGESESRRVAILFNDISERKQNEQILRERSRLSDLHGDIGNALVQIDNLSNLLNDCAEALVKHLDVAFARIWTLNEAENILELCASAGLYTNLDGAHARVPVGKFKIGLIAQEKLPHLTNEIINDPRLSDKEWAQREGMQAFAGYPLIVEKRLVGVMCVFSKHKLTNLTLEAMESVSKGIANAIERKRAEEERQQLLASEQAARRTADNVNRLKDEFLATLSHELRTPLNSILGWSQMLQTRNLEPAEAEKALATIERNARAQNQLIDDLLDVSRIITGKLRLNVCAVDLSSVITTAVDATSPAAQGKNIRLQTLLDPQAGPISGDPDRLQQIVWNLLSNAVKFTPKNGKVQIRLEKVNSHVEIVVSDTGKGIEPEFLPYVFDRFRQSDSSTTRHHGGLGLGLAIVRQLVELHGGTVSATSGGEEQGATFTVSLPLRSVQEREEPPRQEAAPQDASEAEDMNASLNSSKELSELRVLLVDDENDSRELLNHVLSSYGAGVVSANSAASALELIKNANFDVIISDIGMPEEDGYSLIAKIRNLPDEQGGNTPAIALTAYARGEDRVRALRCGFQMHIAKPVEPSELIVVVANLAGRMRNPKSK